MTMLRVQLSIFGLLILVLSDIAAGQEERQLPRWRPFLDSHPPTRLTTYSGLREKLVERNLAPPGEAGRRG
jgi:hypothetical protein